MTNLKISEKNRELISFRELEAEFGDNSAREFDVCQTAPSYVCLNRMALDFTYDGVGVA